MPFRKLVPPFTLTAFISRAPTIPSLETQGQIVGPKTKIKTGGKKFGEQKYERKIRGGSYFSFVLLLVEFFPARFDFRLRPHYLPLGLRGCFNTASYAGYWSRPFATRHYNWFYTKYQPLSQHWTQAPTIF